jgi:hypothetical protein
MRNKKEISLTVTLESGTVIRGGLWAPQVDGYFLQFFPDDGVIQGAEKSFPKILWQ